MSEIEKDFKKVEEKIRAKMEAAAALIKEASLMALDEESVNPEEPEGLTSWNYYDACRPLMQALTEAGWSASSMRC